MSMVDCRMLMDRVPMVDYWQTFGHRRFEMCVLVCDLYVLCIRRQFHAKASSRILNYMEYVKNCVGCTLAIGKSKQACTSELCH
jgi:hypothetical protein